MSSQNWQKLAKTVYERNRYLLDNEHYSDIGFLFKTTDDQEIADGRIFAQKYELAKGSAVFAKTVFEGNADNIVIIIKDFSKESFYEMLKFIYLDEIEVTAENALDILSLSKIYEIDALEEAYSNFIASNLSVDTVFKLLENSLKQNNVSLKIKCVNFIEENTLEVLQHASFVDVDQKTLHVLIDIDPKKCGASPMDFFKAAMKWGKNQCKINDTEDTPKNIREVLGNVFNLICFPNMEADEFIKCLEEDQLFTFEEIGQIFLYIHFQSKRDIKFKVQKTKIC